MASQLFNESAKLPNIIQGTRLHFGLILAILAIILTYLFLYRSKWGYSIRMTGLNNNFAEYSGINTAKVIIYSQIIGGALAGIGGATEVLGMYDRFQWQSLPGIGFDGILVAILARNNPLFVPLGAIFLAYLRVGADVMSRSSDVPSEVIILIQAIMIMLIAAQRFLSKYKHKMVVKESKQNLEIKEGK
ncbi:MAG: ABC transporter permease, partial [Clostridium sp.]